MLACGVPPHCSCNIYVCWPSVTAPLLSNHAYWLSAAARLMLAGPLHFNQHACRSFATQSCMSAGVMLLYLPYLLVWYLPCRGFWFDALLYAMPGDVVPHYQQYLLEWCLTIGNACWHGISRWAMPAGPLPLQPTF